MAKPEYESNPNEPVYKPSEGLTLEEDRQLTFLLHKCSGGFSDPVYTEMAGKLPQPIIELVVLRTNNGVLETLLIPRPKNDIVWRDMFHTPGTALRNRDYEIEGKNPLEVAFKRLQHNEVKSEFAYVPKYVGKVHRTCDRGKEAADVFFTELAENSNNESHIWYPVDQLAENPKFIPHQLGHVLMAAEHYQQYQQSQRENLPKL